MVIPGILEGREGERKNKTQWHNVIAFGQGYAEMTPRLFKGVRAR
jgi:hypothetical protein